MLFITSTTSSSPAGSSSTTDQTADRFASPDAVGGVPTQTKRNPEPVTASSIESVNERRSRLRSTSSASPGSWNGIRPACSASIRSAETSRITTSWPSSARQAPLTSPAYPAPKNAIRAIGRKVTWRPSEGLSPLAIAIIVSLEMLSRIELTTQ